MKEKILHTTTPTARAPSATTPQNATAAQKERETQQRQREAEYADRKAKCVTREQYLEMVRSGKIEAAPTANAQPLITHNMKPTIPLCGACRHFQPTKEKWLGDCMKQHSAHLASDKACKYFSNQDKQK